MEKVGFLKIKHKEEKKKGVNEKCIRGHARLRRERKMI